MKDEILIRYINKHCTATEEKEILEWLKEKDNRQRLFELEQIWGLKAEMRFSDKGRMDEAYRQLSRQLGLSGQIEKREKPSLRKEVIQPQVLLRLPCYDFTPITSFTFGGVLLAVRLPTSGPPGSHGVTGGVYKARERIHRGMLIHDY